MILTKLKWADGTMVVLPLKGPMDMVSEEEEDEFDSDTRGESSARKWLAIDCFYLGQPYNVKVLCVEMSRAWSLQDPKEGHPLTKNHSVLEFTFEKLFKLVTNGGPWESQGR